MTAYYNEIDPYAAQWLRNLITRGHIAPGEVDERSIEDVRPDDLRKFTQCHFFAGIGIWSLALRQAGWPDGRPVWTGSCPCQPFSSAGKGAGVDDERHLWPHFHYLIENCRPPVVFGEQVASKDGLAWLDLVRADLEASGYAIGAADLCAAGVGAPHIRQRLYWVAENGLSNPNPQRQLAFSGQGFCAHSEHDAQSCCGAGRLDNAKCHGRGARRHDHGEHDRVVVDAASQHAQACGLANTAGCGCQSGSGKPCVQAGQSRDLTLPQSAACCGRLDNAVCSGLEGHPGHVHDRDRPGRIDSPADRPVATPSCTNGFWRDADWLPFRDGKIRPVEPGTFPLVDGYPGLVGQLRAYGNAINAETAKVFIQAYLDAAP